MKAQKKTKQTGIIYIQTTRNNTIITLTDMKGNPVVCSSAGCLGFRNSRKSTTYAAQAVTEKIAYKAYTLGFSTVHVQMKGLGYGKESAVRALIKSSLRIVQISDTTAIPHNGCKPSRKRRV